MGGDRTVEGFAREINHLTGDEVKIRWMPFAGLYLQDVETGVIYPLGEGSKKTILTPSEQQSICRALNREHWLVLLGLDAPDDD